MSLPTFTEAMQGFTTNGLTPAEALKKRGAHWNWKLGAELVGRYLNGDDLATCCLVSKHFKKHFMPILWCKPLRILELKSRPFTNTSMFISRVHDASTQALSQVREFDLGRLYSRFYDQKMDTYDLEAIIEVAGAIYDDVWFISRTRLFPYLQCAILDLVPHDERSAGFASDYSLRFGSGLSDGPIDEVPLSPGAPAGTSLGRERSGWALRKIRPMLFSAHGCQSSERSSLINGISTLNLMYLDLSYTKRDSSSLYVLPSLYIGYPNLRVLKLRGLRMIDAEFVRLTQIQGCKLWSLDVTNNLLTDVTVAYLISERFMRDRMPPRKNTTPLPDQDLFEDAPDYQRVDGRTYDGEMLGIGRTPLRPDACDSFSKYIETHTRIPPTDGPFVDDGDSLLRHTGLTHLYISGNRLTSKGAKTIIKYGDRLQVLDIGFVESADEAPSSVPLQFRFGRVWTNCTQYLSREQRSQMEILRIQHGLVTYVPTITLEGSLRFTLDMVAIAEECGVDRLSVVRAKEADYAFSPLLNFRLTKLTLTHIPTKSYQFLIDRLIDFLEDCRVQEAALNQARQHASKSRRAPQLLPGLRTLCLEFLPADTSPLSPDHGSVSGDRDAANFHASSDGDFSFFEDRNTMSSVSRRGSAAPTTGSGPTTPMSRKSSFVGGGLLKRAMSSMSRPSSSGSGSAKSKPPAYAVVEVKDVVQELKKYRAEQAEKEGRWTGELQLVFPYGR